MTDWLIDKSALLRLKRSPEAGEWMSRIDRGLVRISTVTLLEVGYSARSAADLRSLVQEPPVTSMPVVYLTPQIEDRAVVVQSMLADRGRGRAPSIPDLLIAATAERVGLIIVHVDKDYDLIGEITGQAIERLHLRTDDI